MENGGYVDSDDREKLTKTLSTVENGDRKKRLRLVSRSSSVTEDDAQITFSWENIVVQAKPNSSGGETSGGPRGLHNCFGLKKEAKSSDEQSLSVTKADKVPKVILKSASGYVKPGELVAIMGASGAGKSTLLNSLTFRNLQGLELVSGERYANGVMVTPNSLTAVSGYVQQDDLFIGTLSVRETLRFQALVRMERQIPRKLRMERVESVIQELGLSKCADTLIGVPGRLEGISGGELKRLAFACEVLTNPALFFCDEPTSGLDSYMAQNVVTVLRDLARQGKTIVCTIHQPSSEVYSLFDRVLLMAEGRLAYLGELNGARQFFSDAGFICPKNYNPADHYVHVLAVTPGREDECRATIDVICDKFAASTEGRAILAEVAYQKSHKRDLFQLHRYDNKLKKSSPYRATWWEQFRALMWRSFLSVIKEPLLIQLIALILGVIYLDQDYKSQDGVMNVNGALFLILSNMTFQTMFAVINVFCEELPIFLREHFNGMYRPDVYYLCKQIAELPIFVVTTIIFVTIFYWMVGLNEAIDRFLVCNGIVLVVVQVVVSFGYFVSCLAPNQQVALALAPPLIIPVMLFGGFFLNSGSIPEWLEWFKYLSWFNYGNELLLINQWKGVELDCAEGDLCTYENGEAVIDFYGYSEDNYLFDFAMLVALAIGLRLLGFFALLAKTFRKHK